MSTSVKRNFAYQAFYQILAIIVPLITTPYLSRTLGPHGVGIYSYTFSITNYFVMFAMLGMSRYGIREIARVSGADQREERTRIFWGAYAVQIISSLLTLGVYLLYIPTVSEENLVPSLMWITWVVSALFDVSWLCFGMEEFRVPTTISGLTKLGTLVLIFGLVRGPGDAWVYCLAIGAMYLVNQVALWPLVHRYVDFHRPTWAEIKPHIKPNLVLFIPVIAISLYISMDKVMLGAMSGMDQVGYYEYSEKLSKLPLAVITALGTVMMPRMSAALAEGKRDDALSLLESSIWAMLAMAFALSFGIVGIAPEFARVFLGAEFAQCDVLMCVLAVVVPVISITNVLGEQYMLPSGKDNLFTISVCVGAVVNVVLNLFLIPNYQAMGAAISTVAAELAVMAVQGWSVRGELPLGTYAKNALPFAVIGAIMAVVIRTFSSWLDGLWGMTPAGLAIEFLVGATTFSVLAILWVVLSKDKNFEAAFGRSLRRRASRDEAGQS